MSDDPMDLMGDASMKAFHDELNGTVTSQISEARRDMAQVYAACFSTPAGKAVLADMKQKYVLVTRFIPGQGADHGFYREGMAQAVFEIEENLAIAKEPI